MNEPRLENQIIIIVVYITLHIVQGSFCDVNKTENHECNSSTPKTSDTWYWISNNISYWNSNRNGRCTYYCIKVYCTIADLSKMECLAKIL